MGPTILPPAGFLYSVMAHFVEDGVGWVGVVFQPEVFLPLSGDGKLYLGRLVTAVRGEGAFVQRTEFRNDAFILSEKRRVTRRAPPQTKAFVACVPFGSKMTVGPATARRLGSLLKWNHCRYNGEWAELVATSCFRFSVDRTSTPTSARAKIWT